MTNRSLCVLVVVALAACGGGGEEPESAAPAAETAAPAPAAAPVDAATAGAITGKVLLEGEPPEMEAIQMNADPVCAKMHTEPVKTEFVVVGEGGTLQNVFVYVKEGLEGRSFTPPSEPVTLDQRGCIYHPHVFGVMAGQPVEIVNSDDTLHNIHAMPKNNPEFNIGQPVKGLKTTRTFQNPEVMVPFKCDVHKWMNAYAGVLPHPYYSVTGEQGTFALSQLPPGSYVVEAWHERYGTQTQSVTVGEKETKEVSFTYQAGE